MMESRLNRHELPHIAVPSEIRAGSRRQCPGKRVREPNDDAMIWEPFAGQVDGGARPKHKLDLAGNWIAFLPDLLIAAGPELTGATVLHVDKETSTSSRACGAAS
jgi:hypothetical protein